MSPGPPRPGRLPGPTQQKDPSTPERWYADATPFLIHLDLSELVELNTVLEDRNSGLLKAGPVFNTNEDRPSEVLELVRGLFFGLSQQLRVELGSGAGAGRFLRALFLWGPDEGEMAGASAQGLTRTTLSTKWQLKDAERDRNVTAYIFEGAIGNFIETHLAGVPVNVSNIFAVFAAHELGHNLGLTHELAPNDIMFVYDDRPATDQKQWLEAASAGKLRFTGEQVVTMLKLLERP